MGNEGGSNALPSINTSERLTTAAADSGYATCAQADLARNGAIIQKNVAGPAAEPHR